jgi:dinuclear metal center YbgI/SA1388 family protein
MARNHKQATTVGQVEAAMHGIAPPSLAQSWDNVGLLVGDRPAACKKLLLCIDLTPDVLEEAVKNKCDMIISYHPVIFKPMKRLVAQSSDLSSIVHRAIAEGIAVYSPHTAMDAAEGGTNDMLANLCKLQDVQPFEYVTMDDGTCKLVTFAPPNYLDNVAQAMFAAGAGKIGDYEQCSYRLNGEGTFFGTDATSPTVGQKGILEKVQETRIEVEVRGNVLPEVVKALRENHPYEEPAFDLYPLSGKPEKGIGRVGTLPGRSTLGSLARSLKKATKSKVAAIVGQPGTRVQKAAVCVGAAGRLPLEKKRSADADVIVTGEMRHHDALTLLRNGKTAIALGHWESERPALKDLEEKLSQSLGSVNINISQKDVGPFQPIPSR